MIGITELLASRGLDLNGRVKLIRHQDKRFDIEKLIRDGLFDIYQCYQWKPVFNCDFIVSFIGMEGSRSRFHGVFKVAGCCSAKEKPLPSEFDRIANPNGLCYDLQVVPGFEDLKGRVVIDWGKPARAWHRWLTEREVIEILPTGYVREFPGYLDFVISYDELVGIVGNPSANREWHRMLAAVAGVYLIVDTQTGRQYVGSASGEGGILSRWSQYAAIGHGGNKLLKELTAGEANYERHFQFTILRTLPRTLTRLEVIAFESLYKKKLGSRAFGLNSN